tara:strand:- start:600 stop:881 length:282 start_codon:yes stop_codon:yes gene_type:complete
MALPWWKQFPFGNGAEIEANRKSDCERFLASKSDNYTIADPNINNEHVVWRSSSRWAKLKYWKDVMTLVEKTKMQNLRKREVSSSFFTEVINI